MYLLPQDSESENCEIFWGQILTSLLGSHCWLTFVGFQAWVSISQHCRGILVSTIGLISGNVDLFCCSVVTCMPMYMDTFQLKTDILIMTSYLIWISTMSLVVTGAEKHTSGHFNIVWLVMMHRIWLELWLIKCSDFIRIIFIPGMYFK